MICSKLLIQLETKQVAVLMNGVLNHWLKWFAQIQINLEQNTAMLLWDAQMFWSNVIWNYFHLWNRKKQALLCLKRNSLNINSLFFELL